VDKKMFHGHQSCQANWASAGGLGGQSRRKKALGGSEQAGEKRANSEIRANNWNHIQRGTPLGIELHSRQQVFAGNRQEKRGKAQRMVCGVVGGAAQPKRA